MEVTIERILPGGLGLAHVDGQTVMVALATPNDRLRVRVERVKGSVTFASIEEIIEPYLMQIGFLNRTPRGRMATRLTYEHLGLNPRNAATTTPLFE